jgi:hypothetical protein
MRAASVENAPSRVVERFNIGRMGVVSVCGGAEEGIGGIVGDGSVVIGSWFHEPFALTVQSVWGLAKDMSGWKKERGGRKT